MTTVYGKLNNLLTAANAKTGESDTTLTDAMQTLIDGYGGGGGGGSWIKDDGKTYLHININTDLYLTVYLAFGQSVASGNTIDWGDNSTTTPTHTGRALVSHTYASQGEYIITVTNTNGTFYFGYSGTTQGYIFQDGVINGSNNKYSHFNSILRKVELGKGWAINEARQFSACKNLSDVHISTLPSSHALAGNMFEQCPLTSFTYVEGFEEHITSVGSYAFQGTRLAEAPVFPNITVLNYGYMNGASVSKATLWEGLTSIKGRAFYNCDMLAEVVIPSTVTSIEGEAFYGTAGTQYVRLKPTTPPTLANTNAFSGTNANLYYNGTIYVPYSEDHSILTAYQNATNWSSLSSRFVEESA